MHALRGHWCSELMCRVQVPGDAEAALHRLQTKLLDIPAGAKRASREVSHSSPDLLTLLL